MDYINDNELTIVIKTFQRKKALVCLLESIKKYYFHVPIIIVDDSKKTYKKEIISLFSDLKITYIVTDFDIGLSKGRNIGINAVRSKYFLLCDDDFEFDERTNIGRAIKILEEEKFDIVGGRLFEKYRINSLFSFLTILKHPKRIFDFFSNVEISRVFNGFLEINSSSVVARIETNGNLYEEGIEKYSFDIISNFFIARTNKIKEMQGWLPENIKVGEHVLFFIRCKKYGLKIGFTPLLGIRHHPEKSIFYSSFRLRAIKMKKISFLHLGISSFKQFDMHGNLMYIWESGE